MPDSASHGAARMPIAHTRPDPDPVEDWPHLTLIEEAGNRLAETAPDSHRDIIARLVGDLTEWLSSDPVPAVRVAAADSARSTLSAALDGLAEVDCDAHDRMVNMIVGAMHARIADGSKRR